MIIAFRAFLMCNEFLLGSVYFGDKLFIYCLPKFIELLNFSEISNT